MLAYNIVLVIAAVVALGFSLLVFLSSKGDAMSGGSAVRTTYKGKAGFDDFISRLIIILAGLFLLLMIVLDAIAARAS